jgi:hypothetical protein
VLLAAFGRRDEAFQELERALREMAYSLLFIDVDAAMITAYLAALSAAQAGGGDRRRYRLSLDAGVAT